MKRTSRREGKAANKTASQSMTFSSDEKIGFWVAVWVTAADTRSPVLGDETPLVSVVRIVDAGGRWSQLAGMQTAESTAKQNTFIRASIARAGLPATSRDLFLSRGLAEVAPMQGKESQPSINRSARSLLVCLSAILDSSIVCVAWCVYWTRVWQIAVTWQS